MSLFKIHKEVLQSGNFTSINTPTLGQATGSLTLNGLRLYLYLTGNTNNFVWTMNPTAYANWLGKDYSKASEARAVRKAIDAGINDLKNNNYLVETAEGKYDFYDNCNDFPEQKVPKGQENKKKEDDCDVSGIHQSQLIIRMKSSYKNEKLKNNVGGMFYV